MDTEAIDDLRQSYEQACLKVAEMRRVVDQAAETHRQRTFARMRVSDEVKNATDERGFAQTIIEEEFAQFLRGDFPDLCESYGRNCARAFTANNAIQEAHDRLKEATAQQQSARDILEQAEIHYKAAQHEQAEAYRVLREARDQRLTNESTVRP